MLLLAVPDENNYNYLRNVCSTYERLRSEQHTKMVELRKKLPCSDVEIKLAKKPNPAATINHLVKACFKDADLKEMSYEKLKLENESLLQNIHKFVQCIHAPTLIPQAMFSGTISLKCRHLRHESGPKPTKCKRNQSNNIHEERIKKNCKTIQKTEHEQSEDDKENEEHF
ncbi:unnamed protein product [Rotaria sp. Silwood2]|nr:unnamed protein product [Rotaria sp. Silwood2]CAF2775248.1 unnamed protein product [Rotaria sp. Silwood2]CAF2995938.1 unnamed protein product [Rotaria sp. Silwood2]CAF3158709.1 unnamed protein product [Rotaria sp. Silwood2]CAF4100846.1 unnamed protein product [Rotaria sp. Silwood2]